MKQPHGERNHYLYRSPGLEKKRQKSGIKKLPDGLLVVAKAVVGIAKEVTGLRLALYVVEFLAQHQVGLVEGNGLSELTAARVTIACACAKRVCYVQTLVEKGKH